MTLDAFHPVVLDGEPQTGGWRCGRCGTRFDWYVDSRTYCPTAPWSQRRITAFRTRVARLRGA